MTAGWTDRRTRLRKAFIDHYPDEAALWVAAVELVGNPDAPAREALLGHAVRELILRVGRTRAGWQKREGQPDSAILQELATVWAQVVREGSPGNLSPLESPREHAGDTPVTIELGAAARLQDLIQQGAAGTRRAKSNIAQVVNRGPQDPVATRLHTVHNWFVDLSHGLLAPSEADILRNFDVVESILDASLGPVAAALAGVDAVLDLANQRATLPPAESPAPDNGGPQ